MKKWRLLILVCFMFTGMTLLVSRPTVIYADNESLNEDLDKIIQDRDQEQNKVKIEKFKIEKQGQPGIDAWLMGKVFEKILDDMTYKDLIIGAAYTLKDYWAGIYSEDNNHIGVVHEIARIANQEEESIFLSEITFEYDTPNGHGTQTVAVTSNADFTVSECERDFQFMGPDGTRHEHGICSGISPSEIECTFTESEQQIKKTLSSPNGSLVVYDIMPMVLLLGTDVLTKGNFYSIDWFEHTLRQLKFSIVENAPFMPKNGRVVRASMEYGTHVLTTDYYISDEYVLLRKKTVNDSFDDVQAPEILTYLYSSEKDARDKQYIQKYQGTEEHNQE